MKTNSLKKILSGITALCIVGTMGISVSAIGFPGSTTLGDVDNNRVVNVSDLLQLKKAVLGITTLNASATISADMNSDGSINVIDLIMLKKQLLGDQSNVAPPAVEDGITYIHLLGTSITVEGDGATVENNIVTISQSGSFVVDGSMTDGQIYVNIPDEVADPDDVDITLQNVNMSNSIAPSIYVENAENVKLTLEGSNTLTDTSTAAYTLSDGSTIDSVMYVKDDVTFTSSSTGSLDIVSTYNMGIYCNNDVKFNGGSISIDTSNGTKIDAVKAKGTVELAGSTLTVDASGDGVKSTKDTVYVTDGITSIKAGNDAVQGAYIDISAGTIVANGDRSLTADATDTTGAIIGTVNITGGDVFATATDNQITNLNATQSTMLLDYSTEYTKDNTITIEGVGTYTSNKKYAYAIISNSNITSGQTYTIYTGGVQMTHDGSTTGEFTTNNTSTEFTGVTVLEGGATEPSTPVTSADAVKFTFSSSGVTAYDSTGTEVSSSMVSGTTVTITTPGEYAFDGECESGQIVVNVDKTTYPTSDTIDNTVTLSLQGLTLSNTTTSPIYIASIDDECAISVKNGTINTISDGTSYTNTDGKMGAIYSCDDLKIKGKGTLIVNGNGEDGIVSKNDIKLWNGTINVTAVDDAIRGKDSVRIGDPDDIATAGAYDNLKVTVTSTTGDGIKSNNYEDEGKGYITMNGGTVKVTSYGDGIQAEQAININGGTLDITTTATISSSGSTTTQPTRPGQSDTSGTTSTDISAKGIKASLDSTSTLTITEALNITGGTITVTSNDDCIHSNGNATITGGTMTLSSGDDGVHADNILTLGTNGGSEDDFTINVTKSYEGIEAYDIEVYSGRTSAVASDDGFNAAGGDGSGTTNGGWGQGGMSTSTGIINIYGGYIYSRASGDGFDSNGNINMTGGTLLVCGPTSGGNGIFDIGDNGSTFNHTGGIIFGLGTSDMAVYPNSSYISASGTLSSNSLISVADSSGNALAVLTVPSDMNMNGLVIFSNASATSSGYSIYSGSTYSGTLDEHGYGVGGTITGGTALTGSGNINQ